MRILGGVVDGGTRLQAAGIHPEEAELTDERIRRNLEGEGRKGRILGGLTNLLLTCLRIDTLNCGNVNRGRHVIHNSIQKLLNALVLIRSTADYRYHRVGDGGLADSPLDLLFGQLPALEILLKKGVVLLSDMLE